MVYSYRRMELRQLRYFVKVAESLNFSEAAKALCITQSTLSQQIKQLEQEIDDQLFERNSHTMRLTEVGHDLLPYAKDTLQAAENCLNHLNDLQQLLTGSLDIGVTFTFSSILTEVLLSFIEKYPNVRVRVHYKSMAELMTMLTRREVDFVLAFKPTRPYKEIESHVIFGNRLSAIVSKTHPLACEETVTIRQLEQYSLALPSEALQARNALDDILSKSYCGLTACVEVNEVGMLLKLVKQSMLVTILSEASIHNEHDLRAIPLDVQENEVSGCIHVLRNVYRKKSAVRFMQMLRESSIVRHQNITWL